MMCRLYSTVFVIVAVCLFQSRGKLVLESCDPTASECPENSDCRFRDCDGNICICNEGLAPNRDNTICMRTVTLDQSCDDFLQCKGVYSVCVAGSCRCKQGYTPTADNTRCKSKTVFGNSYALLGESCGVDTVCTQQHEQQCVDAVCTCRVGLRPATSSELAAYPFSRFSCRPETYNMGEKPADCNNTDIITGLVGISERCTGVGNCPLNGECVQTCSASECRCKLGYVPNEDNDVCFKVAAIDEICDPTTTICVDAASICTANTCQCLESYSKHDNFGESDLSCQLNSVVGFITFVGYNESCNGVLVLCTSGLSCISKSCQCAPGTSYITSEYRLRNPKLVGVCQADMTTFNQNTCPEVTEAPVITDPTADPGIQTDTTADPVVQTDQTADPVIQTDPTADPVIQTDPTVDPVIQTDPPTTPIIDTNSPPIATDAPVVEVPVVKIGAACDINARANKCPDSSRCEIDECVNARCRCDSDLFSVNDDTECGEGVILGESCDSSTRCIVSGSSCTSSDVCECIGLTRSSDDNLGCLPQSGSTKWAAYGESCSGKTCFLAYELECNETCQCKAGKREKSAAQRRDTYPNSLRCVDNNYNVSRSPFACPRISEPDEPEVVEQSYLPLAFGLTMSVVFVVALALATVTWRRLRKKRTDQSREDDESSRAQDTIVENGGALFKGDNSWGDYRRPYFNPVTNI